MTDNQEHELLKRFPDGVMVRETASGVKNRPALEKLLQQVQAGDTIAVVALDRLGRKLSEILFKIEELYRQKVNVVSLREGVDYSTPTGRLVTQVMLAVAQLERDLIGERTRASLQAKKARGEHVGRRSKYSEATINAAMELRKQGKTFKMISREVGVPASRLCEILRARLSAAAVPSNPV